MALSHTSLFAPREEVWKLQADHVTIEQTHTTFLSNKDRQIPKGLRFVRNLTAKGLPGIQIWTDRT